MEKIDRKRHDKRYQKTIGFIKKHLGEGAKILDLGIQNPFSEIMAEEGYQVINTKGENLDDEYDKYTDLDVDVVTAFEIFEHLFAPYNFLKNTTATKLFASVPLKLWFSDAYWNEKDDWDKHYHEFEPKQFDFLLEKTGWKIVDSEKWMSYDSKLGFRPILRRFTPRHYIVYCERV
ncbi:methyltransferase domain-containing protein [Mangrovivirga cuniculi]|uniref:Methyltransferase n=1 Tax=Mangrovivirga cuniculi TaxID=2715131 RepID=A0A4D7K1N6_9BACT|nr:methyltransferase [Mangrovivirga cuniculi]QCK16865.1 methyltransferase [Mangrovivirga cuniculi]